MGVLILGEGGGGGGYIEIEIELFPLVGLAGHMAIICNAACCCCRSHLFTLGTFSIAYGVLADISTPAERGTYVSALAFGYVPTISHVTHYICTHGHAASNQNVLPFLWGNPFPS